MPAVHVATTGGVTHITVDVGTDFQFTSKRLTNPDRIFFDITGADTENTGSRVIPVAGDAVLKQIREAEPQPGVTRVVLDLAQAAEFSASRASNPERLLIDLGTSKPPAPIAAAAPPAPAIIPVKNVEPKKEPAAAAGESIRFWTQQDVTRVAVRVSPDFNFTPGKLTNPDRVFFDIQGASAASQSIAVNDPRVKRIRTASQAGDTMRVVFDLEQPADFTASSLSNPNRLMIEFRAKDHPAAAPAPEPAPAEKAPVIAKVEPPAPAPAPAPEPVVAKVEPPPAPAPAPAVEPEPSPALAEPTPEPAPEPDPEPAQIAAEVPQLAVAAAILPKRSARDGHLKIVPLQGMDGINDIQRKKGIDPVVEIRDGRDMPVPGAEVTFELPASGPGGYFPGGKRSITTTTSERGQAAALGFTPNDETGKMNIKVTAALDDDVTSFLLAQKNVRDAEIERQSPVRSWKWRVIAIAASAAITTAVILATHGGGSSAPATPAAPPNSISISPGPITIGGPH